MRYLLLAFFSVLISCKGDDIEKDEERSVATRDLVQSVETDKSRYNPGEEVRITLKLKSLEFDSVRVSYRYLSEIVNQQLLPAGETLVELLWNPPPDDFKGYGVEFRFILEDDIVDYASTAVDVSSDWTKFPRYGFLSKFPEMSEASIDRILDKLKSYHINGLQFYDWHHKHHRPLPIDNGEPRPSWQDIARREISFSTVEKYIAGAKERNIASMSYNLLYGAWEGYQQDGVQPDWMIYNDPNQTTVNKHDLDENWAISDIYVANPANPGWQEYIFNSTATIYQHLDFDGWHLDQLGHRGDVYEYSGSPVDLWNTFPPFLNNLDDEFPEKNMALNAVNQYGQLEILTTPVDFAYTEVWPPNESFDDLVRIIHDNRRWNRLTNTVLAAYVNYDLADSPGEFNDPAVLLTDAVIMAFGGAHIELGEHMLGKEYFPNNNLRMSGDLQQRLIEYYDFMVAYQNVLRDEGQPGLTTGITSNEVNISDWEQKAGSVGTFSRNFIDRKVYHLINFQGVSSMQWRDNDGTQTRPEISENFKITLPVNEVSKISYASPDWHDGVQQRLDFQQTSTGYEVTIPYLEYWGMLIVE
jgi:dextranase